MADLHPRSTVKRTPTNQRTERIQKKVLRSVWTSAGSRLGANAQSADRAFAPNVTNNTVYFRYYFLFAKLMTPIIRASCVGLGSRRRKNLARFFSKEENQTRITTIVHNQYPNYQVSLNNYFFVMELSKHKKNVSTTIPFIDCIISKVMIFVQLLTNIYNPISGWLLLTSEIF